VKIVINFMNQLGAGPLNISRSFIKSDILNEKEVIIFCNSKNYSATNSYCTLVPLLIRKTGIIGRIFYENWKISILLYQGNINKYIIFGNYNLCFLPVKRVVLVHHPYLLENNSWSDLHFFPKVREIFKYHIFHSLVKYNSKNVTYVFQSDYMRKKFLTFHPDKLTQVIANPVTDEFRQNDSINVPDLNDTIRSDVKKNSLTLAYISRYYPHKRHDKLFQLIKYLRELGVETRIFVTLDKEITPDCFLKKMCLYPELINLGEVSKYALNKVLRECNATLFLSDRETFGNAIIESLYNEVPVFGFDKGYMHALQPNALTLATTTADLSRKIYRFHTDPNFKRQCEESVLSLRYLSTDEWVETYLSS
jgi:glycosyltransferase involved in cell wall biosynthesis